MADFKRDEVVVGKGIHARIARARSRGGNDIRFALKALALFIVAILASAAASRLAGFRAGPPAEDGPLSVETALLVVNGLSTAALLGIIAFSRVRGLALVLVLFVALFAIQTGMMQIETIAFNASVGMPLPDILRLLVSAAIAAAIISAAAALLFHPAAEGPAAAPPMLGWRLAAAALLYVIAYFAAGQFIAWQFEAVRAYYAAAELPSFGILILLQLFRGLLWALIALFIVLRLRGSLIVRIVLLAAIFAVLAAAPLLYPNPYMPWGVRLGHLMEIGTSEAVWGALAAWILAPRCRNE
jgi:hypothetical protein